MVALRIDTDRLFQPLGEQVSQVFGSAADWVGDGKSLSDRLWSAKRTDRAAIDTMLRESLARGDDPLKTARRLEDYLLPAGRPVRDPSTERLVRWRKDAAGNLLRDASGKLIPVQANGVITRTPRSGAGSYAARRLARTEVSHAFNQGVLDSAALNPFVDGAKWNLSGSHRDADACNDRAQGHSAGMGPGEYGLSEFPQIPAHPHCFPAGTVVSGPPVIGSTQRWHTGQLVEINTADGRFLSVTPNHPILTPQGWIAAGLLNEGGDIVRGDLAERIPSLINPNNNDRPALIEDVAVTLGGSLLVATISMPTATEDFHGDGEGSEVSVIRTNGELGNRLHAAIGQPTREQLLRWRDKEPSLLTRSRISALVFERIWSATDGGVSARSAASQLLRRGLRNHEPLSLGSGAQWHASADQCLMDRRAGDSKRLGNRIDRFAGEIPASNVIDGQQVAPVCPPVTFSSVRIDEIRRSHFSGHVYNLQTTEGWYIANGIVVHNCRCFATKVVTQDADAVVAHLQRELEGGDEPTPIRRPRSVPWRKLVALFNAAKTLLAKEVA